MMSFVRLAAAVLGLSGAAAVCNDDTTCADVAVEAMQTSAMLQVHAAPADADSQDTQTQMSEAAVKQLHEKSLIGVSSGEDSGKRRQKATLMETNKESRACRSAACRTPVPEGLKERHLQAVRSQAALLDSGSKEALLSSKSKDGATATLDAEGFKETTSLCCPVETGIFFVRLLHSMGLEMCSEPHVQGLMHWFSCTPDLDFQIVLDVINHGNPCKYWAKKGQTCPALSATCQGKFCR